LIKFVDAAPPSEIEALVDDGRARGSEVIEAFSHSAYFRTVDETTPAPYHNAARWFESPLGQQTMHALTAACIRLVKETISIGHPGHDRRHICLKDPLSALRCATEEGLNDWRQIFLLGALLHDVGRLPEPRIQSMPMGGVRGEDHAFLSFEIVRLLLEAFPEIPQELRDALLYSIVVHQRGHGRENFGAQLVQRADREQLIGAEFIARAISAGVGLGGFHIKIPTDSRRAVGLELPGTPQHCDLAHHLEFYARNLYPSVGLHAEQHSNAGKVVSGTFLKLAGGTEHHEQLFAPELARDRGVSIQLGRFKSPLTVPCWRAIAEPLEPSLQERCNEARSQNKLLELAYQLCTLPLAANPQKSAVDLSKDKPGTAWDLIEKQIGALDPAESASWHQAFAYALVRNRDASTEDHRIIAAAQDFYRGTPNSVGALLTKFVEREVTSAALRLI
jgi:hypothetical protein